MWLSRTRSMVPLWPDTSLNPLRNTEGRIRNRFCGWTLRSRRLTAGTARRLCRSTTRRRSRGGARGSALCTCRASGTSRCEAGTGSSRTCKISQCTRTTWTCFAPSSDLVSRSREFPVVSSKIRTRSRVFLKRHFGLATRVVLSSRWSLTLYQSTTTLFPNRVLSLGVRFRTVETSSAALPPSWRGAYGVVEGQGPGAAARRAPFVLAATRSEPCLAALEWLRASVLWRYRFACLFLELVSLEAVSRGFPVFPISDHDGARSGLCRGTRASRLSSLEIVTRPETSTTRES